MHKNTVESKGMTLHSAVIDLLIHIWGYEQLSVTLSCMREPGDLRVRLPDSCEVAPDMDDCAIPLSVSVDQAVSEVTSTLSRRARREILTTFDMNETKNQEIRRR
jgi:hypothetical protein